MVSHAFLIDVWILQNPTESDSASPLLIQPKSSHHSPPYGGRVVDTVALPFRAFRPGAAFRALLDLPPPRNDLCPRRRSFRQPRPPTSSSNQRITRAWINYSCASPNPKAEKPKITFRATKHNIQEIAARPSAAFFLGVWRRTGRTKCGQGKKKRTNGYARSRFPTNCPRPLCTA